MKVENYVCGNAENYGKPEVPYRVTSYSGSYAGAG
jgi:hypothetical protein